MAHTPPSLAGRLLTWFLKDEIAEEVLGDLEEKFRITQRAKGLTRAKINYWFQVLHYLRPFAIKSIIRKRQVNIMLKQNIRVSSRIMIKNKVFSAINIGGLALGMIVTVLIGLWIHDELSFNTNHQNYDRIVQVMRKDIRNGTEQVNSSQVSKVSVFLSENYADLFDEVSMTFFRNNPQILSLANESYEYSGYFVEPNAPTILTLDMSSGSRDGLTDPNSILISEKTAEVFFGTANPVGELIKLNLSTELLVAGVFRELPANSTFSDARFFASLGLVYNEHYPRTWDNYNMRVFATLADGVDTESASLAIQNVMKPHRDPADGAQELFLLPMKDWHLRSEYKDGHQMTSRRMNFVKLYGAIGLFVLILACINFMNLNTARFQNRAKEVGIRKVIGSRRSQLVWQFLTESILYAMSALVITLLVVWLTLPWFNAIADKSITFPWSSLWFWSGAVGFAFFTALFAGSYPALSLSSYQPIKALQGMTVPGSKSNFLRQGLVVFQFSVSILLIIGTSTIFQQLEFGKSRAVGYNQSHLITLKGYTQDYHQKFDILRTSLKQTGAVVEVASSNYPLINTLGSNGGFSIDGENEPISGYFNTIMVTPEYGQTVQMELVSGRDFNRSGGDESGNILISELSAAKMGLVDPIGRRIKSKETFNGKNIFTIVGVVKDMIKGSPFDELVPLILFAKNTASSHLFIRLNDQMTYRESLAKVEEVFSEVLPNEPLSYEFVDEAYGSKFRDEEKVSSLASLFTILAVLISCLGLFGLAAYVVELRTKEIGIRKILGADAVALWIRLSRGLVSLVMIASAIAVPLGFYLLNSWLESYSYRIDLSVGLFVLSCFGSLAIALLIISYHTVKVALVNPVESLRSD